MKKTLLIAGMAVFFAGAAMAQTEDTIKPATPVTTEAPVSKDKYNNWTAETYKLQPMPEALTTEKIFPVIGKYELTNKEGQASAVTISLDPSNKGLVWVEGLPYGTIKATLRQSPATYKIPAQKVGEGEEAKDIAEGVLIYDKDANVLNVCVGCTYNAENPATAFLPAVEEEVQPEAEAAPKKTAKAKNVKAKEVVKVKPVHFSGSKMIQETVVVTPVQE